MLGLEQLAPEDRNVVARARRLERFLTQPFYTTEQFSGIKGKLVSLKDALDGCERILRDEFKDYPESALYMIGAIEEVTKKDKTGKPVVKDEPELKTEAESEPNPAADSKPKAKSEPEPEAETEVKSEPEPDVKGKSNPKPGPEAEHAAGTHES